MYDVFMAILKLILGLGLLPAVIGVSKSFCAELAAFHSMDDMFLWGGAAYLMVHLFVYSPKNLFAYMQRIFADLLRFAPTFVAVLLPRMIPMVPGLLLLVLYVAQHTLGVGARAEAYFLFFIGFTLAMHIILTAHELQDEDTSVVKSHYLFSMALAYTVNLVVMGFLLHLNFPHFSFPTFWAGALEETEGIYKVVFQYLVWR